MLSPLQKNKPERIGELGRTQTSPAEIFVLIFFDFLIYVLPCPNFIKQK